MSKFSMGQMVETANAIHTLDAKSVEHALTLYVNCNWGDTNEADAKMNDEAVTSGNQILAVYKDSKGTPFWIITEWDRSVTTILLPEDY